MTDLQALKKLRWVADAAKKGTGYALHTKPNVFTVELTHRIIAGYSSYDDGYQQGKALETPVRIPLPPYWFYLDPENFKFSLVAKPEQMRGKFGMIPQYQYLWQPETWGQPFAPCYGNSKDNSPEGRSTIYDYREAKTWVERAIVASIYLQSALPHYGETWYNTAFAYRLGIVGDEYRDDKVHENTVIAGTPEPAKEPANN
jgi:hypothetical protein